MLTTPNTCECGRDLEPGMQFCDACGRPLAATGTTQRLTPPIGILRDQWTWNEADRNDVEFVPVLDPTLYPFNWDQFHADDA